MWPDQLTSQIYTRKFWGLQIELFIKNLKLSIKISFLRCCNFHVNNHLDITSIGVIFVLIFERNYKSIKILIF